MITWRRTPLQWNYTRLTGHHGPLFIADIFPAVLAQGLKDGAPPAFLSFLPTYDTCDEFDALRLRVREN